MIITMPTIVKKKNWGDWITVDEYGGRVMKVNRAKFILWVEKYPLRNYMIYFYPVLESVLTVYRLVRHKCHMIVVAFSSLI